MAKLLPQCLVNADGIHNEYLTQGVGPHGTFFQMTKVCCHGNSSHISHNDEKSCF